MESGKWKVESGKWKVESRTRDVNNKNRMGGVISLLVLVLCILIFLFRLSGMPVVERWLGVVFLTTALPFSYLLISAKRLGRPSLYYIQIVAILLFILLELFLDYIFQIDFRNEQWMTFLAFWQRANTGM